MAQGTGQGGWSRRGVLAAAGLAATLPAQPAAAQLFGFPIPVAPPTPKETVTAYLKTRADLAGGETGFWFSGDVLAAIEDGPPAPLFRIEGFSVARIVPHADGYRLLGRRIVYPLDAGTGAPLARWLNPFTRKTVDTEALIFDPENALILPRENGPFAPPTATVSGAETWFRQRESRESFDSHTVLATSRDEIANTGLTAVRRATLAFWAMSRFPGWMKMGERRGHLVWNAAGRKLSSVAELPQALRLLTERDYPRFLASPAVWSEPNGDPFAPAPRASTPQR